MSPEILWRLERNDRRIVFAGDESAVLFADTATAAVSRHRHPAWKIILPLRDEPAEVHGSPSGRIDPPAVLIPPQWPHASRVVGGHLAVFLDPQVLPPHNGPLVLSRDDKSRLRDALATGDDLGTAPDLAAIRYELSLHGPGTRLDPRVAQAIDHLDEATTLADVAHTVGLSAPRLRSLVQTQIGVPLAALRRWRRLRNAVTALPGGSVADAAADAGFADQAHLARTARDMIGRPPSSLLPPASPGHSFN